MQISRNGRIDWISGLKGLLSVFVFFHHYTLFFYNSILYGTETGAKTASGIDVLLATEPYGVILNGNFFVCIFITITSFIFAYKRFGNLYNQNDGLIIFTKRILLLFLNCFFCVFIYHSISIIFSFVLSNGYDIERDLNIYSTITNLIFYQWFSRNSSALGFLWPMTYLLFAPIVAYYISSFSNEKRKYIFILYIILGIGVKLVDDYYSAFFFGIAIADIYYFNRLNLKERKTLSIIVGVVSIIIGLFLGGYPSYAQPTNPIYVLLNNSNLKFSYMYLHCIGAGLLLFGLSFFNNRMLSSKIPLILNNISLEIYLLHSMVIHNFSMPLFNLINKSINNYSLSYILVLAQTFILLIFLSFGYKKMITNKINNFVNYIIK